MAHDKSDATFGGDHDHERSVAPAAGARFDRTTDHRSDDEAITLHAERLLVDTEKVRSGAVRLRTKVVTEETTVTVPLRREVLEIIELDDDPDALEGAKGLRKPREIVLHEERVAVETVAYERVVVTRRKVEGAETVEAPVRREVLDIDEA